MRREIPKYEDEKCDTYELAKAISPAIYLYSIGFEAFEWQRIVASSKSNRVILLCSRQAGKSTIVSSIPCHTAKYVDKSLNLVIAPTEDQAKEDILKIKDFIAHDPTYPDLKRDGSDIIQLDNGSRIIVVVATDKACRGYSKPNTVVLDEASRIPDVIYKSGVVPMMNNNKKGRVFMLSTPFGRAGFFYDTWTRQTNTWTKMFVRTPYDVDPSNSLRLIDAEPEREFKERCAAQGIIGLYSPNHADRAGQQEILEEIGETQYQQEFCCDFVEINGQVFRDADLKRYFENRGTPWNSPATRFVPEGQRLAVGAEGFTSSAAPTATASGAAALTPKKLGGKYF